MPQVLVRSHWLLRSNVMNKNSQDNRLLAASISFAVHLAIIAIFCFGLPSFKKKMPEEQVIAIEMLPVADVSNIKTQKVQKDKEVAAEDAKKVHKSKDTPTDLEKEKPKSVEEVKPKLQKDVISIPQKPKPKKILEQKQDKPKEKKKNDIELDSLLKTLEKASEGKEAKSKKKAMSETTDATKESKGQFNDDMPLSISEYQLLRQQIEKHWNVPAGVQNAGEIKITLYLSLKIDGSVDKAELVSKQCPFVNATLCEAAADGALRAVWLASPFQGLSEERYSSWKEFNIEFDPSDMIP